MALAQAVRRVVENYIQVSGYTNFSESRWREAILFYLFGTWGNRQVVTYRPKISFGDITLRLDRQDGEYYAYGHAESPEPLPQLTDIESVLMEVSGKASEVEVALIRFVKDNRIKQLQLCFPACNGGELILWKKDRRSQYGYAGVGLPYAWGTKGPWWTQEEFERGL